MNDYPSYRAPRADGSWLCVPSGQAIDEAWQSNRAHFAVSPCRWLGIPLAEIRRNVRVSLESASQEHEAWYSDTTNVITGIASRRVSMKLDDQPIFLTGHQPELFHAGVWFKNFLLSSMSHAFGGSGFNILIDHDAVGSKASIDVPSRSADGHFHRERISLSVIEGNIPWESADVTDFSAWNHALPEVFERLKSADIHDPLIHRMWPIMDRALHAGKSLGIAFAAGRHHLELGQGLKNCELPLSALTATDGWACFVGELLTRLPEVHSAYNESVENYRRHHRIANLAQPIPNLDRNDNWWEAPFWIYRQKQAIRRALWVRKLGTELELSNQVDSEVYRLPGGTASADWSSAMRGLSEQGIAIRPRAVTTTMFLRLAIGDLFIHGIGGAKYDQLTDRIIHRLWSVPVPTYVVATATVHLPMLQSSETLCDSKATKQRLRDWQFTPDRAVDAPAMNRDSQQFIQEKNQLLGQPIEGSRKSAWHREIQSLNNAIRAQFPGLEGQLRRDHAKALLHEQNVRIRTHREYSIALFPDGYLEAKLNELSCQAMSASRL